MKHNKLIISVFLVLVLAITFTIANAKYIKTYLPKSKNNFSQTTKKNQSKFKRKQRKLRLKLHHQSIKQRFKPTKKTFPNSVPTGPAPSQPVKQEIIITPGQISPLSLFTTCPSDQEKEQIDRDFDIVFIRITDESIHWQDYPYVCDLSSINPTRVKIYNIIRYVKGLSFSQPLPFTQGKSLYDFLTLKTVPADVLKTNDQLTRTSGRLGIELRLGCDGFNTGGDFNASFTGAMSRWYQVMPITNDSCERYVSLRSHDPFLINNFAVHPQLQAPLLIHESYHAITGKPHTGPNGKDLTIDEMGAQAEQFYFNAWVYLYATNVDENTKQLAHQNAAEVLIVGFSQNHCPSDPALKAVVNQITPNTCT